MSAMLQASPIDTAFSRIKAQIQQGRVKVRTLSLAGQQDLALRLADRLTSVESLEMEHFDELHYSEAMALLAEVSQRVQEAIDHADMPLEFMSLPVAQAVPQPVPDETEDGWCSLNEAARITGVKMSTIWYWTNEKKIPTQAHPTDKRIKLVNIADVRAYQQRKKMPIAPQASKLKQPKKATSPRKTVTVAVPITTVPVVAIAPIAISDREKPQRFDEIFMEADWWHDVKPFTPQMVNIWQGVTR